MASYVDYAYYKTVYGGTEIKQLAGAVPESEKITQKKWEERLFNRLSWEACRRIDTLTLNKLKFAFPTDEKDAETVKRCICKLIDIAAQIEAANKRVSEGQGYTTDESGVLRGKVVSSVSSGSESISYTAKAEAGSTLIDVVLSDKSAQDRLYRDTVREYLAFVSDANGVNLLFAGPYPGKREVWK